MNNPKVVGAVGGTIAAISVRTASRATAHLWIEEPIALAAWRHMQECEELNTKAIEGFIAERCNKGPEKLGITCNKE